MEELEPVGDPVGVCVGEGAAETLPDCEALPVALGLAPRDSELVGEAVTVEDAESVVDGVDKGEGVALDVGDPVPLVDTVCDGVALLDSDALPVLDGDAPAVSDAVGEALSVELAEMEEEGVGAAVPLLLPVGVPEEVAEGVEAGVTLLVSDTLGDVEELAPLVSDAVGEEDTVELPESVLLGVPLGDVVGDGVLLPVGLADGVAAALMLPDREVLAVFEGLAPAVSEGVALPLFVLLALSVVLGEGAAVPVPLPDAEAVCEGEGVGGWGH